VTLFSRLFSVCPRVSKRGSNLVASTAWRLRILTLGVLDRTVTFYPKSQEVTIKRRYFWAFPPCRRLRFKAVEAIT
jgi:hypothetical protein